MKNALHRKRLRSILHSIDRGTKDPADKMDTHQVGAWLIHKVPTAAIWETRWSLGGPAPRGSRDSISFAGVS